MRIIFKYSYILVCLAFLQGLVLQNHSFAQRQPFDWPFNNGDRVLVDTCLLRFDVPEESSNSRYDSAMAINHNVYFYPDLSLFFTHHFPWYHVTEGGATKSGNFALVVSSDLFELFPNAPPAADTTWMWRVSLYDNQSERYRYCTNVIEFDTTVFGESLQAFSADVYSISGAFEYRITVADKYWLIALQRKATAPAVLTKYKIGTLLKDVGPYTYYFPTLCSSLKYTYHEQMYSYLDPPGYNRTDVRAVRDTSINDTTYFLGGPDLFPGLSGYPPLRMKNDTLFYRDKNIEHAVPPPVLYLGDMFEDINDFTYHWLVNIAPLNFEGARTSYKFIYEMPGSVDTYKGEDVYASKLGLFTSSKTDDVRFYNTDLTSFIHCQNETWVEEPATCSELSASVYPNPASIGLGIVSLRFAHSVTQPLRIVVCDALGRTVYTSTTPATSQQEIQIPVRSFTPGIYLLSVSAGRDRTTKRILITY